MTSEDPSRHEAAIKRLRDRRALTQDVVAYVVINAGLIIIWALTGGGYFWPAWVLGAWAVGLVLHAWTVFARRPITEDDIKREMDRHGFSYD
jgi:hypothetical protein